MSALFSHIHSHAYANISVYAHMQPHTYRPIDSRKGVAVSSHTHTGQDDVPSHICQHREFIYPVILSFVDLVTWSESRRCRTPGTPGIPVRRWWETRACDLTHTHTQAHMTCSFHSQMSIFPFTFESPSFLFLWILSPSAVLFNPHPPRI